MRINESVRKLDRSWIDGIRSGDEDAFKKIFLTYYPKLSSIAADYLGSWDAGKEVAHVVLAKLWERKSELEILGPLEPYLYRATMNESITVLRKEGRRRDMMERYCVISEPSDYYLDQELDSEELKGKIWNAVRKLPYKRYMVFVLHKRYELSYKEIAGAMNISIKTVENHMGKALKYIREELEKVYSDG